MKTITSFLTALSVILFLLPACSEVTGNGEDDPIIGEEPTELDFAIAIHGGAGAMAPGVYSGKEEQEYLNALDSALRIGEKALADGAPGLDVVVQVISYLEDHPYFNAGQGAVLTAEGACELDASIMEGEELNAGAIAGTRIIKNPIIAARQVLDSSVHVLLSTEGADEWARNTNLEIVENDYFITEKRKASLHKVQKRGTVGCVVLDQNGNLAAGTSTGGMTNKQWGRVGDSPIIGAGTYASNASCAVSCTGHGEYFIRYGAAHDVHSRMVYGGQNLDSAAQATIQAIGDMGATGGLIAVDRKGNISLPFNTAGMFRAYRNHSGREIKIYK